jgi:HPt (histidine-containing phosphotransfer) domain-containing protein
METILDASNLSTLHHLKPNNPGFLTHLIDLFAQDTTVRLAQLREQLAQGDTSQIARAAHPLSSSCANLGVRPMVELCQQLELLAHAAKLEQIAIVADHLDTAVEQARIALYTEWTKG